MTVSKSAKNKEQCQGQGPALGKNGDPMVPRETPRIETRPFAVIADKFLPLPVNPFPIPYRLLVASLTPQSPIDRHRKISMEAIRPTVYRTPGDFVLFGAGTTPSDPIDRYRAMGLVFQGEIPRNGYWIEFVLDVNQELIQFNVKTRDGETPVTLSGTPGSVIITTDLSGPKPDDGTETVIYLEQLNDGPAMEYWSFLRADVYAILIGPRPPSHFSFAAMVDEVHRLHQQTADLPIIVRVTLATNQDDGIVSYCTTDLVYHPAEGDGDESLEPTPYIQSNYLFSDRKSLVGSPPSPGQFDDRSSQPFSTGAADRLGVRLQWNNPRSATLGLTLLTWGNASFQVEMRPQDKLLEGTGLAIGHRTKNAGYLLSFQSVTLASGPPK